MLTLHVVPLYKLKEGSSKVLTAEQTFLRTSTSELIKRIRPYLAGFSGPPSPSSFNVSNKLVKQKLDQPSADSSHIHKKSKIEKSSEIVKKPNIETIIQSSGLSHVN